MRMAALKAVQQLPLNHCYLAAGFVRNLVWDRLHQFDTSPLNDLDVIYFDNSELSLSQHQAQQQHWQQQLQQQLPQHNWQVRNQAIMHLRNGDPAYHNITDAMSYWPECETAVAVRLTDKQQLECISAFGWDSLF